MEAGRFVVKGVIAQQCALRVHCDRRRLRTVAIHPRSHVDLDEESAYERLHRLVPIRLGTDDAPFTVADLEQVTEPLGAVVVELPGPTTRSSASWAGCFRTME
jgi:threonine aldolase